MVPVFVLSGFLGSGKTTLLNALLKEPAFANTAVIVNEFGEIGLDHLLIARGSDNVVLLDAGCLCCTIAESLHETLADLNFRKVRGEIPPFERVIIETTGLAVPGPILNTLLGHRLVTDHYRLEAVVVAVDAQHALANLDVAAEVALQIAVADRLVITKRDLVPVQDALVARLDAINPHAARFDARDAGALTALFGPGERYRLPHRFVHAGVRAANRRGLHVDAANRVRADAFVLPHPPTWSGIAAWWGVAQHRVRRPVAALQGPARNRGDRRDRVRAGRAADISCTRASVRLARRRSSIASRLHHARRRRGRIAPHAARIRCSGGHAARNEAVGLSVGEPAMSSDFVLRGGIVVRPEHSPAPMDILVRDGRIAALLAPGEPVAEGVPVQAATGLHVFPGLIDAHVHFGFGEKITEYDTETIYAAQGGFTTILGYFLNNEAYADVFAREQGYAQTRCRVDYGFHFSTANELHIRELEQYVRDYGVTSFKYFMNFKGEEGRYLGLDGTDDGYLYDLLAESARVGRATIVCHTENIEVVNRIRRRVQAEGGNTLRDWARCKPPFTEAESCVRAMYFAERLGARIYVPHLSTRLALDEVRKWRRRYDDVYRRDLSALPDAHRGFGPRRNRQGESAVSFRRRSRRDLGGACRRVDRRRCFRPLSAQARDQGEEPVARVAGLPRHRDDPARTARPKDFTRAA